MHTQIAPNTFDVLAALAADQSLSSGADVLPLLHAAGLTAQQIADDLGDEPHALRDAWRDALVEAERTLAEQAKQALRAAEYAALDLLRDRLVAAAREAGYEVSVAHASESRSRYVTVCGKDDHVVVRLSDHAARVGARRHIDLSVRDLHQTATRVVDPTDPDMIEAEARRLIDDVLSLAGEPERWDDVAFRDLPPAEQHVAIEARVEYDGGHVSA